jgi:hypothetical protein
MHERFAVVFRGGSAEAAGRLEVEQDRVLLHGRARTGELDLEIPFSELTEIRIGRHASERLNGYATILLERGGKPAVQVAPLGVALVPEIANLLLSLTTRREGDTLAVCVPLKPGCLNRARKLLAKGPPFDPAELGLSGHEVYLHEAEAVFVFRGTDVRVQVSSAIRHPSIWRAGLAWQRCFAGPPHLVDNMALLNLDAAPAYRWEAR